MFESSPSPPPEPQVDLRVPGPRGAADDAVGGAVPGDADGAWRLALEQLAALRAACDGEPGPELASALRALDLSTLDDDALVEVIAAWDRLASWAASRQAVAVEELRVRRETRGRAEFVGDEVALRLGITRRGGEAKVGDAALLSRVPAVWDALDRGAIDLYKARVLCEELLALPASLRFDVAAELLPLAPTLTAPQLRARIRRRAIAADPAAAARAHARERAARFVSVEPVRDGMAWLHAFLPAPEALAVHATLSALADAQPSDDPRPVDARRADALVDVVTRWLEAGVAPDGRALPRRQGRRPHLQVVVAASTLAGLDDAPAELTGYGPLTADVARELAYGASWELKPVDSRTGEVAVGTRGARDGTPRGRPPKAGGPPRDRGPTRTEPSGAGGPPRVVEWQGYRPPATLAADVVARDRTCTFPGCRTPAARCDIDHIAPFDPTRPATDQTVGENLHALCRHHHRLKTFGGWAVERDPATGRTRWTAPTGHEYVREPERTGPSEPGATAGR